jgi:hypothetical protein
VQHVPTMNKNLVSGPFYAEMGLRLFQSLIKVVVSKFGQFIGKAYECGGLFRISLSDFYMRCNESLVKFQSFYVIL